MVWQYLFSIEVFITRVWKEQRIIWSLIIISFIRIKDFKVFLNFYLQLTIDQELFFTSQSPIHFFLHIHKHSPLVLHSQFTVCSQVPNFVHNLLYFRRYENKHIDLYQTWITGVTHEAVQILMLLMDIKLYNFSTYSVIK